VFGTNEDFRGWLPIEQVGKTEIGTGRVVGRTDLRTKNDAVGISSQDLEGHDMPAVRSNADEVTEGLLGLAREGNIINSVEYRLVPVEAEKGTDINGYPQENGQGNGPVERLACSAVQDEAYVL
jgi:hypothetical protein